MAKTEAQVHETHEMYQQMRRDRLMQFADDPAMLPTAGTPVVHIDDEPGTSKPGVVMAVTERLRNEANDYCAADEDVMVPVMWTDTYVRWEYGGDLARARQRD